jgi:cyclohexadieny/prephenate dehydrogenase
VTTSATVCIVGVGLLGGSLALSLKRRRLAGRVVGTDRLPGLLSRGLERGMIDEAEPDLGRAVASADVVVFCTPVDVIAAQAIEASAHCKPGTLLTDVGSTKSAIVAAVEGRMPAGVDFVGAHPLAGSEKSGPEYAQVDLFEGRLVVLTPSATTPVAALDRARAFWVDLGARVEVLGAAEHDHALALTSHLPHLVASVLSGILPCEWRGLTATGFRDTTRLAGGSPEMWKAIFLNNRESVLQAVDHFRIHLAQFRAAIAFGDARALERLLDDAKRIRDGLPTR